MESNTSFLQINFKGYIAGNSYIHKLDTRTKIFSSMIIIGSSVSVNDLIPLIIMLSFVFLLMLVSDIKCSYILSPIPPLMPFLFIAVLFRLFSHTQENKVIFDIIWQWKIFIISENSLIGSFVLILRFLIIFILISLFSASTKLEDFTKAIEQIGRPLQKIGMPAHEFSMVISIAVSFFHVLINEMNRIIKAQVSRGADFEIKKINLIKRIKSILPLIIPLFSFSLEHSKHLIEAMEARCYRGGKGRSYYILEKYSKRDYIFLAISIFIAVLSICFAKMFNFVKIF